MKKNIWKAATALVASFGCVASGLAQVSFSVDMDLGTPGIQNTRMASPGDSFTVGLILNVDAAGVSSYSISGQFDTTELSLNGATPAANNPALPGGLFSLGAPTWNNALGWVHSMNGATLGIGPASTSFSVGTISYSVPAAFNDGLADIIPGFFNAGVDGYFDNAGQPVAPTFNPGYVLPQEGTGSVPETGSTLALFVCGLVGLGLAGRRGSREKDQFRMAVR